MNMFKDEEKNIRGNKEKEESSQKEAKETQYFLKDKILKNKILKDKKSEKNDEKEYSEGKESKIKSKIKEQKMMRKSKEHHKRRSIKIIIILTLIISLSLVAGIIGHSFLKKSHSASGLPNLNNNITQIYNGFKFKKELIGWSTLVRVGNKVYDLRIRYSPREVEYIKVMNESAIKNRILSSDIVYIALDPFMPSSVALSAMEISKVLNPRKNNTGILGIPAIIGVTTIPSGYEGKALKVDCNNASSETLLEKENPSKENRTSQPFFVSVIKYVLNKSNDNAIYLKNNCIIVSGKNTTVLEEAGDRMVYSLLNIIPSAKN